MKHELFGTLRHQKDDEQWHAYVRLPEFAQCDLYYDGQSWADLEEAEAKEKQQPHTPGAVEKALDKMSNKVADWIAKDMAEYGDDFVGEETDDATYEREQAMERARFRNGIFLVEIEDSKGAGPSPEQEKAFRALVENEADTLAKLLAAIHEQYMSMVKSDSGWFASFPKPKTPDGVKKMIRCTSVRVSEYHLKGIAYIGFSFYCLWDDEHGLAVLMHGDRIVEVGDYDALSNVPEADNFPGDVPMTPHQELVQAVFAGDEDKINELLAAGADINAVSKDDYPPLHAALGMGEPHFVERLLKLGANPNLKDDEGKTALQAAQKLAKTLDLNQKSILMRLAMRFAQFFNAGGFNDWRRKTHRMVELLKQHRAKSGDN